MSAEFVFAGASPPDRSRQEHDTYAMSSGGNRGTTNVEVVETTVGDALYGSDFGQSESGSILGYQLDVAPQLAHYQLTGRS